MRKYANDCSQHAENAEYWGVSTAWAQEYLTWMAMYTHTAYALVIPRMINGVPFLIIAESTGESTIKQAENQRANDSNQVITDPFWQYFKVWQYEGLSILNWRGIHMRKYNGQSLPANLGRYLRDFATFANVEYPETPMWQGPMLSPLRTFLQSLGIPLWLEITAGCSQWEYAGLDSYIRIFGSNIESSSQEAWYLLNTHSPVGQRRFLRPEEWGHMRVLAQLGPEGHGVRV